MQILNRPTHIDFMGKRKLALLFSAVLMLGAIAVLAVRGLNFGIDFTGGTLVEVGYPEPVALDGIRQALQQGGFGDATVQHFGTSQDVLVRLASRKDTTTAELSTQMFRALSGTGGGTLELRRVEFVGPQIGEELTEDGGLAMLYALFGILIYVSVRFEYRFALGSVAALVHDVILTLGFFSLMQVEFDLSVLAAVLAVIGYSLNDTIVVFDRIRENFRRMRRGTSEEIVNASLNQTLSRTVMTSVTTLIVLVALYFLGGEIIHGFATALIVGVVVGTYSSVYIASSVVLALGVGKADLMPAKKEGGEAQERP